MTIRNRTEKAKARKGASVNVALTKFGLAAYRYQQAQERAEKCQHPLTDATMYMAHHDHPGVCTAYAKFVLEGMPVCGKHASYILLQAAYKAGISK